MFFFVGNFYITGTIYVVFNLGGMGMGWMLTQNHGVYIWRFPEIGLRASHHPDVHGIFPYKPTGYWGTPMSGNPHIDDPPGAARNASSSASVASTTAPSTRRKVRPRRDVARLGEETKVWTRPGEVGGCYNGYWWISINVVLMDLNINAWTWISIDIILYNWQILF